MEAITPSLKTQIQQIFDNPMIKDSYGKVKPCYCWNFEKYYYT